MKSRHSRAAVSVALVALPSFGGAGGVDAAAGRDAIARVPKPNAGFGGSEAAGTIGRVGVRRAGDTTSGGVAQGIEQQPSKLTVAGSNPAAPVHRSACYLVTSRGGARGVQNADHGAGQLWANTSRLELAPCMLDSNRHGAHRLVPSVRDAMRVLGNCEPRRAGSDLVCHPHSASAFVEPHRHECMATAVRRSALDA